MAQRRHLPATRQLCAHQPRRPAGTRPYPQRRPVPSLPACAISPHLEGAFCQKDPRGLAQREIPRPVPEAPACGSFSAAPLSRRPCSISITITARSSTNARESARRRCCNITSAIFRRGILKWCGTTVFWPTASGARCCRRFTTRWR